MKRLSISVAGISGIVFASGLVLSGMTRPEKVLGFLDINGEWDLSLVFVMVGAILVHSLVYHLWLKKQIRPVWAEAFSLPQQQHIDKRLIIGAALFGVGWGMSGYCPGPILVSIASAKLDVFVFVASMITGMLLFELFARNSRKSVDVEA